MDVVKRTNDVIVIKVKFDAADEAINTERKSCSFAVLKGIYYTRKQFPH